MLTIEEAKDAKAKWIWSSNDGRGAAGSCRARQWVTGTDEASLQGSKITWYLGEQQWIEP